MTFLNTITDFKLNKKFLFIKEKKHLTFASQDP